MDKSQQARATGGVEFSAGIGCEEIYVIEVFVESARRVLGAGACVDGKPVDGGFEFDHGTGNEAGGWPTDGVEGEVGINSGRFLVCLNEDETYGPARGEG